MSVTRIATRYAKSLLDLAIEQGKLEQVHADITSLRGALQNRDLMLMLKSPIISNDKKAGALKALFGANMDVLTMAYMNLLVNKNREGYLPEISAEFVNQYKTLKGISTVRVTTAAPLGEEMLASLRTKLAASGVVSSNLDIQTIVDPDLVGGFVLEFDNKRYDASVAQKLNELKAQFTKNLYIKEF